MRFVAVSALVASALVFSSGFAFAGDPREDSRAAFRRGVDQAQSGDYKAARDSFQEAYKLFAHPSILLNLGIARARTGEYLEAEQDLIRFLSDDGGAPANEIVSARSELAEVRTHLGSFRLRVSPPGASARLDARSIALIPGKFVEVRATVGSHALHVEAQGYAPVDRTVPIEATRTGEVELALVPKSGARPIDDPAAESKDNRTTAGVALVSGGVLLAGFGIGAGLRARSLANDYNTPGSGSFQDPSTRSTGTTFRTLADVAFIAALAAGGFGVYFLVTAPPNNAAPSTGTSPSRTASPPSVRVVVAPSFAGVAGSF